MSPSAAQEQPRTASTPATFSWPTPPYASYRDDSEGVSGWPCAVEGVNGQTRNCLLMSVTPANRVALIQVPPAQVNTIDGLRVDWPDGFGLIRASNTTPVLVLRFEGQTPEALHRIEARMMALLKSVKPDALIQQAAH